MLRLKNIIKSMRTLILLLSLLLSSPLINAQITKIRSAKLSTKRNSVGFICFMESVQDIFVYNIEADSLRRLTTSESLNFDEQYKTSLNWIDDSNIIFLSKHTGQVQQYILDIQRGNLSSHSTSEGDEYSLCYSPKSKETYYVSSVRGKEPAIFRRGLISYEPKSITSKNINYGFPQLSLDNRLLAFYEMPIGNPLIYSIESDKFLNLKLPKKNVRILSWTVDSNKFIYKHTKFIYGEPTTSLHLYDLTTHKSSTLMKNANDLYSAILMTEGTKYMYSTSKKSYLVDINSKNVEEHEVKGDLDSWIIDNTSLLIIANDKAFIYDIQNRKKKSIIN